MATTAQIQAIVERFITDADVAHQIVHGGPTTTVTTLGGNVDTFAKLMADLTQEFESGFGGIFDTVVGGYMTAAQTAATAAASSASSAAASAATVVTIGENIDGKLAEASDSASQAASSAASAATSATNAQSSATASGTSASAAQSSALSAQTAAQSASTSATAAGTSATTASSAATTASNAATTATAGVSTISSSLTSAQAAATTASTKASEAAASATTATTKAGEASASATAAAGSATSASSSATSAGNSATSAATSASNATAAATTSMNAHLAASDPHSQYATDADLSAVSSVANAAQSGVSTLAGKVGNLAGQVAVSSNVTLTLADAGKIISIGGSANGTITLPAPTLIGATFLLNNFGTYTWTVTTPSGVLLPPPQSTTTYSASMTLPPQGKVHIYADGTNWIVFFSGLELSKPFCIARVPSTGSTGGIETGAFVVVPISTADHDQEGWLDTTNYSYRPKRAGWYRFTGNVYIGIAGSTSNRYNIEAAFWINGGGNNETQQITIASNGTNGSDTAYILHGNTSIFLNGTTDYVQLYAYGANVNCKIVSMTNTRYLGTWMEVEYIRP